MKYLIKTARAMRHLGAALARACQPGTVIYLHGTLGVGKTTLMRGFLQQLGHHRAVRSPTFTLVESYQFQGSRVYHFDLYRLTEPQEFTYLGGRDYFTEDSICVFEWPEHGVPVIKAADLSCVLEFSGVKQQRVLELRALSPRGQEILKSLPYASKN